MTQARRDSPRIPYDEAICLARIDGKGRLYGRGLDLSASGISLVSSGVLSDRDRDQVRPPAAARTSLGDREDRARHRRAGRLRAGRRFRRAQAGCGGGDRQSDRRAHQADAPRQAAHRWGRQAAPLRGARRRADGAVDRDAAVSAARRRRRRRAGRARGNRRGGNHPQDRRRSGDQRRHPAARAGRRARRRAARRAPSATGRRGPRIRRRSPRSARARPPTNLPPPCGHPLPSVVVAAGLARDARAVEARPPRRRVHGTAEIARRPDLAAWALRPAAVMATVHPLAAAIATERLTTLEMAAWWSRGLVGGGAARGGAGGWPSSIHATSATRPGAESAPD